MMATSKKFTSIEKTKLACILMSRRQNTEQNSNKKFTNKSLEGIAKVRYFETTDHKKLDSWRNCDENKFGEC